MTDSEYLTVEETQELAGVHRNTVVYWIRTGLVSATKNKFHFWQLPKAQVMALMADRQTQRRGRLAKRPDGSVKDGKR